MQYSSSSDNAKTTEFNSTTQCFGRLSFICGSSSPVLRGNYGSMVELTGKIRSGANANQIKPLGVNVPVNGGLGFHAMFDEATNVFTLSKQNFQSCGDLEASAGILELAASATWMYGTNFTARGTGTLRFGTSAQVNSSFAKLHIADDGIVELPEGAEVSVRHLYVDGEELAPGTYDPETTGPTAGHIVGGSVRVVTEVCPPYVETTEDKTASGDWEINIDQNCTNVVLVAQTGTGKIVKRGRGILILRATSSFTGGIDLEAGYVYVEADDALGFGEVKIFGSQDRTDKYSGPCELRFTKSGITCGSETSNGQPSIHVIGQNSTHFPAIGLHSATNRFYGNITADYDLYVMEDSYWLYNWYKAQKGKAYWSSNVSQNENMKYYGAITVAGKMHLLPDSIHRFYGPLDVGFYETIVTTDEDYRSRGWDNDQSSYGQTYFYAANRIGKIQYGYRNLNFFADDGLGGAQISNVVTTVGDALSYLSASPSTTPSRHTVASLYNAKPTAGGTASGAAVYGDGPKTLVVTGFAANVELPTYTVFNGNLSLILDAKDNPGYTMTLLGRTSSTIGDLIVSNGVLKLKGDAVFSAPASITVASGGKIIVETTAAAFNSAPIVRIDGELSAGEGVERVFKSGITISKLYLSSSARLKLNDEAITVTEMYVDGQQVKADTYTSEGLPGVLDGVSVKVTSGNFPAASETADWIGGNDQLTTTMVNWKDSPASLPLANGTLQANLKDGTTMKVTSGTWLNTIVNELPQTNEAGRIIQFTVGPEEEGGDIVLSRGLLSRGHTQSEKHGQLFLKGHFKMPYGATGGSAASDNQYAIRFYTSTYNKSLPGAYEPVRYGSDATLPLVLAGATFDMPFYMYIANNVTQLAVTNDTVNVFNAAAGYYGNQSASYYGAGSLTTFRAGVKGSNCHHFYGPGTICLENGPMYFDNGAYLKGGITAIFCSADNFATGNSSREGIGLECGTIECRTNDCFRHTLQLYSNGNVWQIMKFNTTTQQLGHIYFTSTDSKSYLHGEYGSMLEVNGTARSDATASQLKQLLCSMPVKGGLGFHMMSADATFDTLTLSKRSFESCGDLEASSGTLELAANAKWLNGTNFTARGTGKLKFNAAGQVGGDIAVFHFADSGKVEIPAGVTLRISAAEVGGTTVEDGVYTKDSTGTMANRIVGEGTLRIGRKGTTLILF